jgi:cytochrome c peroxidase
VELFTAAFPDQVAAAGDIRYVHAANAISAYEAQVFRFDNSPFDQYLRGDHLVLTARQKRGMKLFYGKAGCAGCHSGALQTDHEFHAIAMPQVGPGKGDGLAGREDFGRERVTGQARDRFRFRTPSLRNLPLTAPYGHAGTYASVESVVRHHLNPTESLYDYDLEQLLLPSRADLDDTDRLVAENSQAVAAIAGANELSAMQLKEEELRELLAFLGALVDPAALDLRTTVPRRVPSGLPVLE